MKAASLDAESLREVALREGAVLFGLAEIEDIKDRFLLSASETHGLCRAVSIAVPLSPSVLSGIDDHPTLLYKWHYQQANNLLDRIAFRMTARLIGLGRRALPVPASQIVDWRGNRAHLSHRMIAERAGLGWRGKSNLTVTERFGSAVRFATVLIDIPLETGRPVDPACGACDRCVLACPAGALGEKPEDYRLDLCHARLTEFSKERGIGVHICGVCVRACPRSVPPFRNSEA
jgi:epoxyqueuosine reductase